MVMIRSLKRKFGISAPRVAVRPEVPAYVRWLGIIAVAVLAMGLSWGMYDAGRRFAGFDKNETDYELERLSEVSSRLQRENDELRMKIASFDRQPPEGRSRFFPELGFRYGKNRTACFHQRIKT
jgi:hypothetical protein